MYNEETNYFKKIVKSFEEPGWSIRGGSETIQNGAKKRKKADSSVIFRYIRC